jgi:hypothetical protein
MAMSRTGASIALLTLWFSFPPAAAAQNYREVRDDFPPRHLAAVNLQVAFPQEEFKDFVGTGYGVGGHLTIYLDRASRIGLRLFGSWIQYGRTTERLPLSPTLPGLLVDLTTENNIYSFGVGPEFVLSTGPLRPYLAAAIGASDFATVTSVEGTNNSSSFASTTNFNDWTFLWYGGGGLGFRVRSGPNPIFIDAGLRYQHHGQTRYLREGSIRDLGGGNIGFTPIESKTTLLVLHLGAQIGF